MPAFTALDCEATCGTPPSGTCVPENDDSLRVTGVNLTFNREFTEFKNAEGCVYAVSAKNPTATIELEAEIVDKNIGLAAMHVGSDMSSLGYGLANFAGLCRGFNYDDGGCIVLDDVSNACQEDSPPTTTMSFTYYPHITP